MRGSDFNYLIEFDKKILKDEYNYGLRTPNLSQNTNMLNIHCDRINESHVDGDENDIIIIQFQHICSMTKLYLYVRTKKSDL